VNNSAFPHFAWWATIYELACIVGVVLVVGYDSIEPYRVAVHSPFLFVSLVVDVDE